MIKNQRQYRTTRDQIELLTTALNHARAIAAPDVFTKAHIQSLETDIRTLEDEVRQYDSLLQGPLDLTSLRDVEHLGQDLIRARISARLTHKDLAKALGKKEQAIQRLEAANYSTASLATLAEIANTIMRLRDVA